VEVETYGRGRTGKFCLNADFHGTFRDLLHAANLRHGIHGFTSLPKEGVLRIFPPLKIGGLRPGLNPRTWVPEASTLTPRQPKPLLYFVLVKDRDKSNSRNQTVFNQPMWLELAVMMTTKINNNRLIDLYLRVNTTDYSF
jgi:hypothetical protein